MKKSNKQQKNETKQQAATLRFQVGFKSKTAYPAMSEEVQARINQELDWFINNHFAQGVMDIKAIADEARTQFKCRIGGDHGFLGGSAVGYALGLVGQDPIAASKISPEFTAETAPTCLNVSLHLDPEKRNEVAAWAAEHFKSPVMTRMGVFIIKLGNVIVEFHRNLKNV